MSFTAPIQPLPIFMYLFKSWILFMSIVSFVILKKSLKHINLFILVIIGICNDLVDTSCKTCFWYILCKRPKNPIPGFVSYNKHKHNCISLTSCTRTSSRSPSFLVDNYNSQILDVLLFQNESSQPVAQPLRTLVVPSEEQGSIPSTLMVDYDGM